MKDWEKISRFLYFSRLVFKKKIIRGPCIINRLSLSFASGLTKLQKTNPKKPLMADKSSKGKGKTPTFADRFGAQNPAADTSATSKRERVVSVDATSSQGANTVYTMDKESKNKVGGQRFAVIKFAGPVNARVRAKAVFLGVYGCFDTMEEADKQAALVRKEDDRFDVSVVAMYILGQVPPSKDMEPLIRKKYEDKMFNRIMTGQQDSIQQSKREMDDRIAKDRAEAEAKMRKQYGADYVPITKPDSVKQYEAESVDRAERVEKMSFSQKDIIESFAKFIQGTKDQPGAIDPRAAGEFMRFLEARKGAESAMAAEDASSSPVSVSVVATTDAADSSDAPSEAPAPAAQ